eukprot:SAG11_NODE_3575_length_2359_cov_3.684071_2_plen_88_part_00
MLGVADLDGTHPIDSCPIVVPEMPAPNCGSAGIGGKNKSHPWICDIGDLDQGKNPIDDSVLDHTDPGLIGMHTCTAMSNLFSSVSES